MKHRKQALWALPLAFALLATACGGDDGEGSTSTTAGTETTTSGGGTATDDAVDLKGVCPDNIVIQTDWFPEAEHGALYNMVGDDPSIDEDRERPTRGVRRAEHRRHDRDPHRRPGHRLPDRRLTAQGRPRHPARLHAHR